MLWTLPNKGRIIKGPREVTDWHVTDLITMITLITLITMISSITLITMITKRLGDKHVYNDIPFRQNQTLVVNSHSNLSYRHC